MRLLSGTLCGAAILLGAISSQAQTTSKAGEDIPSSWPRFQVSGHKGDKAMVAQIERMDWWKVCVAWGTEARKKAKTRRHWALQEYLQWNKLINGLDLGGVADKVPAIGMTTCGAYAVLGMPERLNTSKGSYGTHVQHIWSSRRVYVYTNSSTDEGNAIVSSVQF